MDDFSFDFLDTDYNKKAFCRTSFVLNRTKKGTRKRNKN